MGFSDMPWATAAVMWLGLALIFGGVIAFLASLWHEQKAYQRSLRRFDARVGRDVYRDTKGVTR